MEYVIDGGRIDSLDEFFAEISRVLMPGQIPVRSLDAFNDILAGGFGTPEDGFTLRWMNAAASRANLDHAETARQLERQLASCHPDHRDRVGRELALARARVRPSSTGW